jgi:hypothetical protein
MFDIPARLSHPGVQAGVCLPFEAYAYFYQVFNKFLNVKQSKI